MQIGQFFQKLNPVRIYKAEVKLRQEVKAAEFRDDIVGALKRDHNSVIRENIIGRPYVIFTSVAQKYEAPFYRVYKAKLTYCGRDETSGVPVEFPGEMYEMAMQHHQSRFAPKGYGE